MIQLNPRNLLLHTPGAAPASLDRGALLAELRQACDACAVDSSWLADHLLDALEAKVADANEAGQRLSPADVRGNLCTALRHSGLGEVADAFERAPATAAAPVATATADLPPPLLPTRYITPAEWAAALPAPLAPLARQHLVEFETLSDLLPAPVLKVRLARLLEAPDAPRDDLALLGALQRLLDQLPAVLAAMRVLVGQRWPEITPASIRLRVTDLDAFVQFAVPNRGRKAFRERVETLIAQRLAAVTPPCPLLFR